MQSILQAAAVVTPDLLPVLDSVCELAEWFGSGEDFDALVVLAKQHSQAVTALLVAAEAVGRSQMQDDLALDRSRKRLEELAVAAALSRLDIVVLVQHLPAGYSSKMAVALRSCSNGPYLALEGALVSYCWGVVTIHCQHRPARVAGDLEEACW